jgi:uncharacterized membrane protein YkvA (DUF1232 family)
MGKDKPAPVSLVEGWKRRAGELQLETYALYLAYQDPRTPGYARAWALLVVTYALSPIDLIPDFIPILGLLDDLLLVPLGIALALRMIPAGVMEDARTQAHQDPGPGWPVKWAAVVVILLIWVAVLAPVVFVLLRWLNRS